MLNGTNTGTPTALWSRTASQTAPNAAFTYVDVRNSSSMTMHIKNTGGTTGLVFTTEVTGDPLGVTGWAASANRQPGGGAYAATANTVAAGASRTLFFDPTDNVCFIRLNISTNDTTNSLVTLTYEV